MHASAARQEASEANSLPMLASSAQGRFAANNAAARLRTKSAASVSAYARAMGKAMP